MYQPVSLIKNEQVEALLSQIWKNRATSLSLNKVKQWFEYTELCKKFNNRQDKLIEEAIK